MALVFPIEKESGMRTRPVFLFNQFILYRKRWTLLRPVLVAEEKRDSDGALQ